MTDSSRFLATTVAVLALTAPAFAANEEAPGQLKKAVPVPQAPAATTPLVETTPTVITTAPHANTNAKAPVNQGTIKKVLKQQTSTTRSSGTGTTAAPLRTVQRGAPHHTRQITTSPRTATRPPRRVSHTRLAPAAGGGGGSTSRSTHAPTPVASLAPVVTVSPPHARAAVPQTTTVDRVPAAKKAPTPLTSISRAADRVVEVIPGAILLALAGLAALVLVLIVRSWYMERRRNRALEQSYGVTVEALATAIEAKDHCTGGHIERVRKLGLLLASEIVPREAKDPQMAYGFLLHDIGKLAVPDEILRAPGQLDAGQWALMRRHPEEGVRMLSTVPFLDKALDVVRHHHERWDGGGYPDGLVGQEIPLWARIFSVVDALDAMTAARPYRPARPYAEALEEIRRHAGTQFDPAVVEALERIDPAEIEPLLEPGQIIDSPLAPVVDLRPLLHA